MGDFIDVRRLRPGDVFRPAGGYKPRRCWALRHVSLNDVHTVIRYSLADGTAGTSDFRVGTTVERLAVLDLADIPGMVELFLGTAGDGDHLTFTKFDGKIYT